MVNTSSHDSDWSFDFRANPCYDSGSDSDCDDNQPNQMASNTVDDLNSIDLSSRKETVSYKPNPFSIAKINAAYRTKTSNDPDTVQRTTSTSKESSKSKPIQSTIMEGFKTQISKNRTSKPQPRKVSPRKAFRAANATSEQTSTTLVSSSNAQSTPLKLNGSTTGDHAPLKGSGAYPARDQALAVDLDSTLHKTEHVSPPQMGSHMFSRSTNAHTLTSNRHNPISMPVQKDKFGSSDHTTRIALPPNRTVSTWCTVGHERSSLSSPLRARDAFTDMHHPSFSSPVKPWVTPSQSGHDMQNVTLRGPSVTMTIPVSRQPHLLIKSESPTNTSRHALRSYSPTPIKPQTVSKQPQKFMRGDQSYHKRSRSERDAYDIFNDPDEEWTTLPPRKQNKTKLQAKTFPALTKSFRLPGLLPLENVSNTQRTVTSGRRIHTYLPPPPVPPCGASSVTLASGNASVRRAYGTDSDETSPSSTEAQMASYKIHSDQQTHGANDGVVINISFGDVRVDTESTLSPSSSGGPSHPDHAETDMRLNVDVQAVRSKYPAKRAFLREVLLFFIIFFVH
ncbi:hypothetical protein CVT25_002501 [Psilocybe cyanescens]|uniref:Uncharacterized protein n=1 Tax=Psilocybe cyanescens TaxID=93625 RepID=A0A409XUC0_PSICY|nr:hypothetical protein CVT25_002501 [Psilocybe cyanescens]